MPKPDRNLLVNRNPGLLNEWDYDKNSHDVNTILYDSYTAVWWKCIHDHSWKTRVSCRTRGLGCPKCKILTDDSKCLANNDPHGICEEWDHENNEDLTPYDVLARSSQRVWWKCLKSNHKWKARVRSRQDYPDCPSCIRLVYEERLSKLWHTEWCGKFDENKTAYTWWKCPQQGHIWIATVKKQKKILNCPYCYNIKLDNTHSLMNNDPNHICLEWDFVKNKRNVPQQVRPNDNIVVWWKCPNNHSWKCSVSDRTKGATCGVCSGVIEVYSSDESEEYVPFPVRHSLNSSLSDDSSDSDEESEEF